MSRRLVAKLTIVSLLLSAVPALRAQEQDAVFVHGGATNGSSWSAAAQRLAADLQIRQHIAELTWQNQIGTQAAQLQGQFGSLPASTIAVGHSNGGVVSREWSRIHPVSGIATIGTPHSGMPLWTHALDIVNFNWRGFDLMYSVYEAFNIDYDEWWWVLAAAEGWIAFTYDVASQSLLHFAGTIGFTGGIPMIPQMAPGSQYLTANLNGSGNIAREASQIPSRVGIVNVADRYWEGGVFRAAGQDSRWWSIAMNTAAVGIDIYAGYLYASPDSWDWEKAGRMLTLSSWFWEDEELWCRAVSDPNPLTYGACLPNDSVVPAWSQQYPGALRINVSDGPIHMREKQEGHDVLYSVLTNNLHVAPRGGSGPDPGSDGEISLYEHILFDGESLSSSGDLSFVGWTWNDRISSLRIPAGKTVVLYEHIDFGGASLTLTGDQVDLRDHAGPGVDGTWNDAVSSIRIY
jgi:pimeloyl-ACP methyl ester carboxylesterase